MGERKVLNKYYPPDFDPSKLPKLPVPKDRQYVVRLMAPFTMRCLTCGNYVYKGKKFNARKETAIGETYLGIQIYRFYIRCPRCLAEISFKTDPQNEDYAVENGAYRTFQAHRLAELEEERLQQEKEEEEANNPMLALENRTKESRREMDVLDALEEIRDWNARNAQVKFDDLMEKHLEDERNAREEEVKREDEILKKVFGKRQEIVRRLKDDSDSDSEDKPVTKKPKVDELAPKQPSFSRKKLASMVVVRKGSKPHEKSEGPCSAANSHKETGVDHGTPSTGKDSADDSTSGGVAKSETADLNKRTPASSLSLLGAYSDSDEEST